METWFKGRWKTKSKIRKLKRRSSLASYKELTVNDRLSWPEFCKNKKQHNIRNNTLSSFISEKKKWTISPKQLMKWKLIFEEILSYV